MGSYNSVQTAIDSWQHRRHYVFMLPYLLIAPTLLWLAVVIFYPIFAGIRFSFFDISIPFPNMLPEFVGLDNYIDMAKDPAFWHSFLVTWLYTGCVVAGTFVVGLFFALILNSKFRGRILARTAIILPWAIPYVVAALIWQWMFSTEYGVINFFLIKLGILSEKISWLMVPSKAFGALVVAVIWREFPFVTVMLLAGLQTIPHALYEAAMIDGAGRLQRFRYITLPGLRHITISIVVLEAIWALKRMTMIFILTKGGPARATETLVINTYLQAFNSYKMSYASAIGTTTLIIILVFTVIYLRFVRYAEK